MASLIPGYEYDIFISYRQKDNKGEQWVSEFVEALKTELESTFKEDISLYFDINPHDGLLETHDVNASLKEKLKCLIFIPIISQTYCDPKSFAWEHEFVAFNKMAREDLFGRDIRLPGGNVSSRILPVRIHDLDHEDKTLLENELGGVLRSIEFIYKSSGVNRPLRAVEDHPHDNLNKTYYRDQINKVANAVKEIITSLKKHNQPDGGIASEHAEVKHGKPGKPIKTILNIILSSFFILALTSLGIFYIPKLFQSRGTFERSVAVLPFENLSNDPEQEFFVDGMVDEILDRLFKIGDIKVITMTSSMKYKENKITFKDIAREHGVSAVLGGSVLKIGDDVRIIVQLIDANTNTLIWSDKFDGNLIVAFSFQSNVALSVARELKAKLSSKEESLINNAASTTNQVAYDFYLKGNGFSLRLMPDSALKMFTNAIREDPYFAVAYAKRAKVHMYRYWTKNLGWQGHDQLAREDIIAGLKIEPELIELKMVEAFGLYQLDREYNDALKILNELKKKAPSIADLYAYTSYILRRQGKFEESIKEARLSLQLDPFHASYIDILSQTYQLLHQYDKVIECARQGLSIMPDNKAFNNYIFNAFIFKTGNLKNALNESGLKEKDVLYHLYYFNRDYDKLTDFILKKSTIVADQITYQPKAFRLALIYYLKGEKSLCKIYADSAITHLQEKIKEDPSDERYHSTLGKCYGLIGNNREAIACGKHAIDLKPVKVDYFQGISAEQGLMEIYLITGNHDLALGSIEYLLSVPSWLSAGSLIADPLFDNIRNLPEFQKILKNVSN
jgi:TolB-like protein